MSQPVSRRELARWAINQLATGRSARTLAKQLAAELVASGRGKQADLLLSDISAELELSGQLAELTITTATKLSTELRKNLVAYVKNAATVKDVIVKETIDPSVLGGFKLETANRTWDKTVARQLADIKGGL